VAESLRRTLIVPIANVAGEIMKKAEETGEWIHEWIQGWP